MSRNNQDRIGPNVESADPPIPQSYQEPFKEPMHFVVPTEFVDLPSGGKYYPQGHPLHNVGEVEIKFMTAKEEDILTDKTLLKKGIAIDRLIKSILVDKSINTADLFTGDRNAILIAARASAYGPDYDTKVACPVCFYHGRHEFNLNNASVICNDNLEEDGIKRSEGGTIFFTTPKLRAEVECKIMTGGDEKRILDQQKNNKKHRLPENNLTTQLRTIIVSVNGNTDGGYINSFIDACPALDSRHIRTMYQKCVPGIELKEEYVCGECGSSTMIDVPFTTDFFWPK